MGLTTVMHELKQLLLSHSPDAVVITETKLNKRICNSRGIKDIFEGYTLFHSCNAPVNNYSEERQIMARWITMTLEVSLSLSRISSLGQAQSS